MKLEVIIFGITAFFIYNAYYDGKYTKLLLSYKKYAQMAGIIFVAFSIYLMIKRNPKQTQRMLLYSNNLVRHMPMDKSTLNLMSPIFDFTKTDESTNKSSSSATTSFMQNFNSYFNPTTASMVPQEQQQSLLSGYKSANKKTTKRAVSETKKKYVAYRQDWKCGQCGKQLTHTFEIDHRIRLEYGGSNDPSNLVALCRECHGEKTARENM